MRPILAIIGIMAGMVAGGWFAANYGGDYISSLTFESPDEVSQASEYVLLAGLAIGAIIGAFVGWLLGSVFKRRSS